MKHTKTLILSMTLALSMPTSVLAHPLPPPTDSNYQHGNCTWIRPLALRAGWQHNEIPKLISIIKRESGCCPNRRGGDMVDANCNITHVSTWSHRSDSGLLQLNGVNWDSQRIGRVAYLCAMRIACTQNVLLDPYTNLLAGRALYQLMGWSPWQIHKRGRP